MNRLTVVGAFPSLRIRCILHWQVLNRTYKAKSPPQGGLFARRGTAELVADVRK